MWPFMRRAKPFLVQFERKFCQLKADFLKGQITRAFQPTEDIVNADV